jgi:hypothetical protein
MAVTGEAIAAAPAGWAQSTLGDSEVVLLAGPGGLDAIDGAARALGQRVVSVLRRDADGQVAEATVIAQAASLPLVWIAAQFSDEARAWAHDRGPMTLLVPADGALSEDDRARIARFATLLARQTD